MGSAKQFWDWFEQNNASYFFLNQLDNEAEREKLLEEFLKQLHLYCPKLFFEIGGMPDETQDLIITADGNVAYFPDVEALVAEAPRMENWNVIAFKPATDGSFAIEYEGVDFDPNEAWFMPLENAAKPGALGLRIFIEKIDHEQKIQLVTAAYLVLDSLLGEKTNALAIQHVEFAQFGERTDRSGLIRLAEIAQYVRWKQSSQ
jgi:hypothetical protein